MSYFDDDDEEEIQGQNDIIRVSGTVVVDNDEHDPLDDFM